MKTPQVCKLRLPHYWNQLQNCASVTWSFIFTFGKQKFNPCTTVKLIPMNAALILNTIVLTQIAVTRSILMTHAPSICERHTKFIREQTPACVASNSDHNAIQRASVDSSSNDKRSLCSNKNRPFTTRNILPIMNHVYQWQRR